MTPLSVFRHLAHVHFLMPIYRRVIL